MRPLRILIWHVHGSYLLYLTSKSRHQFFVPSKPDRSGDYVGRWGHMPWGDNVHDIPAEEVSRIELDCVIYQTPGQYLEERFAILSPAQQKLPAIYLQHDPPLDHPTDQKHWVDDPAMLLVHVTAFNALMWDSNRTPTRVVEHGVPEPAGVQYRGMHERGIVVINHLAQRGRRLGGDVYERVLRDIPLDLVGMAAEEMPGGLREVIHANLATFTADYRFFFNPIRYTSLGLAVIEAMMIGMPVVGLATTEMVTTIQNGVSGYLDTCVGSLVPRMRQLLKEPHHAAELGKNARKHALTRFHIDRFTSDWDRVLREFTQL